MKDMHDGSYTESIIHTKWRVHTIESTNDEGYTQ